MTDAVIVDVVRTPSGKGKAGGQLSGAHPADLLGAGVPESVPATTVDRQCGSGQQAVHFAAQGVLSGAYEVVIAGGIVPVTVTGDDGSERVLTIDETVRPDTTEEGLAALKPAFADERVRERFPEIDWKITAGNSSPLTDGAAAALIMSEARAVSPGLRPRARFRGFAVAGSDPLLMLTGVIPATQKILARSSLSIEDMDAYEVNEAFAPVPLLWQHNLNADPAKLNPRGGAIALGHPLGASGVRPPATLVNHLEATGGRYGLRTMCEGGGMANAMIIERL